MRSQETVVTKAMRHAERLQALSKTQQRFVVRIIDALKTAD
jgi:hypothetical protein